MDVCKETTSINYCLNETFRDKVPEIRVFNFGIQESDQISKSHIFSICDGTDNDQIMLSKNITYRCKSTCQKFFLVHREICNIGQQNV